MSILNRLKAIHNRQIKTKATRRRRNRAARASRKKNR